MMYQFHEDDLEQATLEWLEELGYETLHGPDIAVDGEYPESESYQEVVLHDRLEEALRKINPSASSSSIEREIQLVKNNELSSLNLNNHNFKRFVTDRIDG